MLSRVEGIALAMFSLCIDSVKHTGLELDAYFLHGLYPQLFGMVLLPLTGNFVLFENTTSEIWDGECFTLMSVFFFSFQNIC